MNKKVIEALVEEDVGTKKTRYEYSTQNKKIVADFLEQQKEAGIPCRYDVVYDENNNTYIELIEPDLALTETELTILTQLNCSKTTKKLIKHVKIIKGILIFFCILVCVSLTVGLIYIGQLLSELSSLSSTSIW